MQPGDPEYEKLKRSLDEFGYVEPVIWNKRTGNVVGGHQRLKVLQQEGLSEIDCVVIDMDTEKEKALNIALNKISGDWDTDKLALLITDLQGSDFDVSLTGFDPAELDDLFKADIKDGVHDDDFDVDAELKKPVFSKAGDMWQLGIHRLLCGDSTQPETYQRLLQGTPVNLVVTDPPYNVNYEGRAGKSRTITCRTTSSTNSYMMRFPACTPSWQTMPESMCFTPTPRDLTLGKPSRMPVFIYPAAASG